MGAGGGGEVTVRLPGLADRRTSLTADREASAHPGHRSREVIVDGNRGYRLRPYRHLGATAAEASLGIGGARPERGGDLPGARSQLA